MTTGSPNLAPVLGEGRKGSVSKANPEPEKPNPSGLASTQACGGPA